MADETSALQQAQAKLAELLEAAKTGALIPVRLPGQIEEIATLVDQAAEEHAQELKQAADNAAPADMQSYMEEESYFVGHAIHELRTPVTSIRGYGDMLGQMGELSDMQKQFLDVMKTNTRRLESLLWDVSYTNKLRKRTLKVSAKMDMFKNIAMRVEKDMQPLAASLERKLVLDIPQGLPLMETDGDLLAEALKRLVDNGLKYSPGTADKDKDEDKDKVGQVTLSATTDPQTDNTLLIQVRDNGIGMTAQELEQLGTIYFRSDNDTVRNYKGSGLGIIVAYGMIELLGGSVEVASVPQQGTTFTIRLKGMSS
jgi:two-component system, sensor histidine kinase ChiS